MNKIHKPSPPPPKPKPPPHHEEWPWEKKGKRGMYWSCLSLYDGQILLFNIKGKLNIMALTLTDTQQAVGQLAFVDAKGYPTTDADVTITSSDVTIATVSFDPSTDQVTVVAIAPGVAAITVVALDGKGNPLPFPDTAIEVIPGSAVGGSITFGVPTEQPAPPTTI